MRPARNDAPIRVLFLCQRPESWVNVRSAWETMSTDERFAPDVLVLPYNHSAKGTDQAQASALRAFFDRLGVAYLDPERDGFQLRPDAYDVAIFNAPYDLERPPEYHFDRVGAKVAHTVYVPYGLAVGAGSKNRSYQYAQPAQIGASSVIARSHAEKDLYARYCPAGDGHVRVLGLPRMDQLRHLERFEVDDALRAGIGGRFAVLWNSHFSFGRRHANGLCYSSFDVMASGLFAFAAENPDVALLWRPHPGLFPVLCDEGILLPEQLPALRRELASAGIVLDERADHRHAFVASHALLTDPGSFLIEYLATGKPLAYLHAEGSEGLNEEGLALQQCIPTVTGPAQAVMFIERLRHGARPAPEALQRLRERFLPGMDGSAGRRLAEHLLDLVAGRGTPELPAGSTDASTSMPLPSSIADGVATHPSGVNADRYPVLATLCARLADLQARKRQVAAHRGPWHAAVIAARASMSEALKRRPRLMRIVLRATGRL